MKGIILGALLLVLAMACHAQEEGRLRNVTVDCDKTVLTYDNSKTKVIYNDSIGRRIHRIIEANAKKSLRDTFINSLGIGVYINGVSYTEYFGELDKKEANTPSDMTIYEIASVSKTFTGTLAAKAILDGKLQLDDDIRLYLPNDFSNLQYKGKAIRFKHLLTHTSGLPANNPEFENIPTGLNQDEISRYFYEIERKQTKEMFLTYLAEMQIDTFPGTSFNYSNFGTNLTAYILERVYQKDFQTLIMEELITKAEMKNTKFHLNPTEQTYLANGYNGLGQRMPELPLANTLWGGEGGMKSTIPDMLKYIRYQLDNRNLMAKESHKKIYEIDKDYWIGYFWWIISNNNHDLHYRHDGGALGTRNVLLIYPDSNIGISIFTNVATEGVFENLSELSRNIYDDIKDQ